ncbi:acetolactate synthase large subunit [Williamsia maris]|uniref:acetolactate synthase n=1 Tax=Williamsia maris TaxID=72806 RepID=A0ABT1HJ48_9NOCA|nr:acetolactate synthase large subunit [Williamsia maris]MCP2177966.1 acetolactate synthase-1/2/3 large subunit [Williamsia maris]
MTNGANAVISSLVDSGVQVCFGNPGTSEMHFVAALDSVPQMRAVLCLFEGVVTGAADGYARVTGRPAATLLHLGPGMANGLANLHNARRAHTPIVNIVGDHATHHHRYDAPLESDIATLGSWLQGWTRTATSTDTVGQDVADAVAASTDGAGQIATVILPADISWTAGGTVGTAVPAVARAVPDEQVIAAVADVLTSGAMTVILIGAEATRADGLLAVSRIANATGATVLVETFPAALDRGAGIPSFERLGYLAEQAQAQLDGTEHLVLIGTRSPVSFFAYPDKASDLVPDGAQVHTLVDIRDDVIGAVTALADRVAAEQTATLQDRVEVETPTGDLTLANWVQVVGAVLPENTIISDEANTSGLMLPTATAGAPRHQVLTLTGGAIGQGLPVAVGAAIAAPDRPVLALQSDGSALYTISALWTMARENLNVTTILLNNSAYAILRMELQRVGAQSGGEKANSLLDLSHPDMDFVAISTGFGVPAVRVTTAEDLATELRNAFAEDGPHLIEAIVPPLM